MKKLLKKLHMNWFGASWFLKLKFEKWAKIGHGRRNLIIWEHLLIFRFAHPGHKKSVALSNLNTNMMLEPHAEAKCYLIFLAILGSEIWVADTRYLRFVWLAVLILSQWSQNLIPLNFFSSSTAGTRRMFYFF